MSNKRTLNAAELAARRRNAQKSTGPKSQEGKLRSSMNGRKSIFGTDLLSEGESTAALKNLMAEVFDSMQPAPGLEETMCRKIASDLWSINRLKSVEKRLCNGEMHVFEGEAVRCMKYTDLTFLQKYAAQTERSYVRSMRELHLLQQRRREREVADSTSPDNS